jgi:hypothetical protein
VPKPVFEHLQQGAWGDFHLLFHMSRKWYQIGSSGRAFLTANKVTASSRQEGFPGNGIEFFCMHRAMIEHLNERFGSVPVSNNAGRRNFSEVLLGWETDADVTRALLQIGGDDQYFQQGLEQTNDFGSFASEDDFANYLQTMTRPGILPLGSVMLTTDGTPAKRAFTQDTRSGAGIHNWLHGAFAEGGSSPIDVGDAKLNLGNNVFWHIHGWIEAKWKVQEKQKKGM